MLRPRTVAPSLSSRFSIVFVAAAAIVVLTAPGHGQAQQTRTTSVSQPLPTAFDRGVSYNESRVFDSAEMLSRASLRATRSRTRTGRSGAPYERGRVLVKFRATRAPALRLRALAAVAPSGVIETRAPYVDFDSVSIGEDDDAEDVAARLMQQADVEWAQADYRVYPRFVPNDTLYGQLQWNFRTINLEKAWDIQKGASSDIIVAVLDTGIAFKTVNQTYFAGPFTYEGRSYPQLGLITVPLARAPDLATSDTRFVAPRDFIWNDNSPVDLLGHGTHVAGTIGQLTNNSLSVAGIAFNVRLMPIKVLDSEWDDIFNSPNVGTDQLVAQGIRYAADNGANIINMSLGRTGPPNTAFPVEEAIRYAVGKGCLVVLAGGNEFEDGNPLEVIAEIASRVQGAISVAATDRNGNRAYYSSTGSWVELAAPGGSVRTSNGLVYQQTYDFTETDTYELPPSQFKAPRFDIFATIGIQGTSMAAPHVSGVAALLMQQGVKKPAAIEAALERFATDRAAPGRDGETGYGEVNALATLRGLGLAR